MTRREYKNPPIEEALCEFRFEPESEWNPMLPLSFRESIKSSYPGTPRQKTPIEADVHAGSENGGPSFLLKQEVSRMQFPSEDGKKLVAIGQNVVSAHTLRPYPSWDVFRPQIKEALESYVKIIGVKGIRRIGLRYINKIEVDVEGTVSLNEYFAVPPQAPQGFPSRFIKFFTRTEYVYDDEPIRLIMNFTDIDTSEGKAAFLLDIDMVWEWVSEPLPTQEAMDKVDILRKREREAFELIITDRAREMFNDE